MSKLNIAIALCSRVIGGHEYQLYELVKSMNRYSYVTIYVNSIEQYSFFSNLSLKVELIEGLLLRRGYLPIQYLVGWRSKKFFNDLFEEFDHVIISAGAIEAAISVGYAIYRRKSISLYLPFFYDRVPEWGVFGYIYNYFLAKSCKMFDQIITINRIQAKLIKSITKIRTIVAPNKIREVSQSLIYASPRLIFVGRLSEQKRIFELINWLDTKSNPIKNFILIGDGPLRFDLESLSKKTKYIECVFFGWLSAQAQDNVIYKSDILIINSLQEGEPLVLREARLRGMHILARDIFGVRGITKYYERFSSKEDLIKKLSVISIGGNSGNMGRRKNMAKQMELQRLVRIKRLITSIDNLIKK